jgi:hypothetical protein
MTSARIEPATFRLVEQHLNRSDTAIPPFISQLTKNVMNNTSTITENRKKLQVVKIAEK